MATPLPGVPQPVVPAATIMQNIPLVNIMTFGMCSSMSNPTVSSATAAAQGVLTPMPCVPATAAPWTPGLPMHTACGLPLATNMSKCACSFGGMISVTAPAAPTVKVSP